MADVTVKLSAKVMATNATYASDFSGDSGIGSMVDAVAGMHYLVETYFSSFSSWAFKEASPSSQLKLTYTYPNSASATYQIPNSTRTPSTAIVDDYTFKNSAITIHDTGALNYDYYASDTYLWLAPTGGVLSSSTITTTLSAKDADPTVGNVSLTIDGAISFDQSGNFSGGLTSISGSATKYFSTFGLSGDFNVVGNKAASYSSLYAESGVSSTLVSGTLNSYFENYRDGSKVVISGISLPLVADTSLDETLLEDENLFPDNDTFVVNLGAASTSTLTIMSGAGNDSLDILGGSGTLNVDAGTGNDSIIIRDGNHQVSGGYGDDTYVITGKSGAGLVLLEAEGAGVDTVQSVLSWTLSANFENLTLTGKTTINGGGNDLVNVLTGNVAANVLDGGAGADTLIGGKGNDTYAVDDTGDVVTENASEGTDIVKASISCTLATNVENLTLIGTAAIAGSGNSLANTLTGNDGANVLDGGIGKDKLVGGLGNDSYVVDLTTTGALEDIVTEKAGEGIDNLLLRGNPSLTKAATLTLGGNIENLDASGTASTLLNLNGNAVANLLIGNAAANTLDGKGGDDTLIGGAGKDTLSGGSGADTFVFDSLPTTSAEADLIKDFISGTDVLAFDTDVFSALTFNPEGSLAPEQFAQGAGLIAATDVATRLVYDTSTGNLYYDQDGSGELAAMLLATLGTTTHSTLSAADLCSFTA